VTLINKTLKFLVLFSIIALSMIVASVNVLPSVHADGLGSSEIFVSPGRTHLDVGNTTINIDITNVSGIASIQFDLTWDPTILSASSFTEVLFHNRTPSADWGYIWQLYLDINNPSGELAYAVTWINLGWAEAGGYCPLNVTTPEPIATVTFTMLAANASAYTTLHLSDVKVGDENASPIPVNTVADGAIWRLVGDLNGDGVVDIYDAILLADSFGSHGPNHDYSGEPASPNWNADADLNGDGIIDIYDSIILCSHFGTHVP
jgi:hypothetical protein